MRYSKFSEGEYLSVLMILSQRKTHCSSEPNSREAHKSEQSLGTENRQNLHREVAQNFHLEVRSGDPAEKFQYNMELNYPNRPLLVQNLHLARGDKLKGSFLNHHHAHYKERY